jgi:hypothetical protein
MGGTSTISGGKLCLRIDPRVPMLSGCAASRGPTIKANTVPFSWIMASIHEGLVKDWQRTQLAGYISKSLQIMRLSCSERRLAPLDSWIGQSGLRSLDVLHRRTTRASHDETKDALACRPYADLSVTAYLAATGRLRK